MEIFETINLYLSTHPEMLANLEFFFRIKYWLLLGLAFYFVSLPYRQRRKDIKEQAELAKDRNKFLA